jgi:DNA-binding FadR family transcriptional regulator
MIIKYRNVTDFAMKYICERFNRGDKLLPQDDGCAITGISRGAWREAVARLNAKGVIAMSHGKPSVISVDPLSSEEHY